MLQIYTAAQAAQMLDCSVKTVEDMARRGELPGIKPGGSWVFPGAALDRRLNEMATEKAARLRAPSTPFASTVQVAESKRTKPGARQARPLPKLVDMTGAAGVVA